MAKTRHSKKAPARRRHTRASRPSPTPPYVPPMLRAGGERPLQHEVTARMDRPSKPATEKPQPVLLQLRKGMEHTYANMCATLDAADRFLMRTGRVTKDGDGLVAGAGPTTAEGPHLQELENLARALDYGTARMGRIVSALEEIG